MRLKSLITAAFLILMLTSVPGADSEDATTSGSLSNATKTKTEDSISSSTKDMDSVEKPEPIGTLDVLDGAHVKYFTTLPGSAGKPKTTVRIVTGEIDVYEIYDWAQHHQELSGQSGHVWYRVDPLESHWIYGLSRFNYAPR